MLKQIKQGDKMKIVILKRSNKLNSTDKPLKKMKQISFSLGTV
jgi:hypothetical protein